jgi:hypothetical protein
MNFYVYVGNNPLLFNDPFGLWKNTGVPSDPSKNTIVCNGKGGVRVQLSNDFDELPDFRKCLANCTQKHEESHAREVLKTNPKICRGSVDGIQIGFSNNKEQAASEIAAYNVELHCFKQQKQQAKCDYCTPYIDIQSNYIKNTQLPKWNQELSPNVPKVDY